jgi:TRAP-type C4-dicarboxylate transport system substrate-binding protein
MKYTEVNKFATVTQHMLTECPVIVNKKFWASLSPAQQKLFHEAADVQIKVNREGNAKGRAEAAETAKAQGVEVVTLTPRSGMPSRKQYNLFMTNIKMYLAAPGLIFPEKDCVIFKIQVINRERACPFP